MDDRDPTKRFEPDQASLRREPRRCPHCGEALPAEPEVMAPDERVYDPNRPEVRWNERRRRVELFGGDSGYSEADPFTIHADRVADTADVARWMARIAGEEWCRGQEFLDGLASALCNAENATTPADPPAAS